MRNEQGGTLVEPVGRAFASTRAMLVQVQAGQRRRLRRALRGMCEPCESLGWSGTIPQHPPSLDHQIVHGHSHLARPCLWALLRQ